MPLHLDYRPPDFDLVMGNYRVKDALNQLFLRDISEIPHSFLFYGPSGCGKTTFSRIIGKILLDCDMDKLLKSPDYIEINTGNNRGIDTARRVLADLQYSPLTSQRRIYLLDEVHQATKDFQNSLLKALEDTPSHTYFLLCTTEPEKLLKTIRNRCHMFEVEPLSDKDMIRLISEVVQAEINEGKLNAKYVDESIMREIALAADGCPRQALVILDQIIDLDPRRMRRNVKSFRADERAAIELCRAMIKGSSWGIVKDIIAGNPDDPEKVRRAVIGYMTAILLKGTNADAYRIYKAFERPFYDNGRPALIIAAYRAVMNEDIPY